MRNQRPTAKSVRKPRETERSSAPRAKRASKVEEASFRTNLRSSVSSFVGRVRDRESIARLFADGARLVTVLGMGGVGKTRVATRFAEEAVPQFSTPGAGGAWFCDLTDARTPAAAAEVVASVLGIRLSTASDELELARDLGRAIAARKAILLVLDNFEQLAPHAETTVGEWLRAAPQARFLVTSRVALEVGGEYRWPLQPLELPNTQSHDGEALRAIEAVDLFIRRARQIDPELEVDEPALQSIADIVTRVEGIPLAIELAAARLGVLSIAQLAERTHSSLDMLVKSGEKGRHASMRRAILDSYDALGPEERNGLVGCAVFSGGFSLAAAEAILGLPERPFLWALEKLRAHSLVRVQHLKGGEPRFSLSEPIREFASEELDSEAHRRESLGTSHARYYATVASDYLSSSRHRRDHSALGPLNLERDNLLVAHARAVALRMPLGVEWALSIALAVEPVLGARGLFQSQLALLDRTLALVAIASPSPDLDWASLHLARGRANRVLGRLKEARGDFDNALSIAEAAGDPGRQALAHLGIGELVETEGETALARKHFGVALACVERMPDSGETRLVRGEIFERTAHALRRENALGEAEVQIERAISGYRAESHREPLARSLYEAGVIALFREHLDDARSRFDEALEIARSEGARYVESLASSGLGILHQERGELDEALAHNWAAVEIARELGTQYREASALYYLAGTYLERSQPEDAARIVRRALELVRLVGAPRYEALLEGCHAILLAQRGDHLAAREAIQRANRAASACVSEAPLQCAIRIHALHVEALGSAKDQLASALERAMALEGARANDDPRFALRCLAAESAHRGQARAEPLVVRAGGRSFRVPNTKADIDLSRRKPLARIVEALARRRIESPGEGLALDELLSLGWPGERVDPDAGANRVYVALTTLRKMGLRTAIVTSASGYALDSSVVCELEGNTSSGS